MVHDRHDEFSGTTFGRGRYRTLRRIGGGGMAVVHEAHDRALDRVVAVKRLRPDLAEDAVARSRFAREAQHAAALDHPAIVRVYDTGEDDGPTGPIPWIVMELVRGHTLRALLRHHGGPLPWRRALRIVAPVLDALDYSHARGIVHRDIKPVNVMVAEDGAVKVMDFGIARVVHDGSAPLTAVGHIMGTPQYFSPEQALGHPASPRSDVYSVGCLLYELLVGTVPFDGDSAITVASKHVRDEPLPPSAYRDVPGAVDDLVLHALRKDPQLRFAGAAEMRSAVGRILPDALSGRAPGHPSRDSRARARNRSRTPGPGVRRGAAEPRGGRVPRRRGRVRRRVAWGAVAVATLLLASVLAAALR
ncbi:protein kinase [Yinghuangia sp. ASG 101]|uniref:protein kinase domain-containing protein n=1 Tax=Yinghuangia sp. ASG 101 TaxID=2896848 RepID=UPI001E3ED8AC|nr:protein kinase [Yinghuangia sp. ASG 101]UGQ15229.1 protein kinase [Yinghuangia sp. ASG 101]